MTRFDRLVWGGIAFAGALIFYPLTARTVALFARSILP